MRKKITSLTLIASLLLFLGISALEVDAKNKHDIDGIQQERKGIQEDISLQEQNINKLFEDMNELNSEIQRLDGLIGEKQARVDEITYEIDTTIEEITALQEEMEQLENSIEERFEILKNRASSYQKSGGLINYIEVLFGAESFGDFISRLTAVNQIMDSDVTLMEQLEEDIKLVEEYQLTTIEKLNELNDMYAEQQSELVSIEEEKQQQEQAHEALQQARQELMAYVEELEAEDGRLQSLEEKVKREIAEAERKEREQKRLRAMEKEKEEEAKKLAEKEQKNDSKLVQVSKVESKAGNHQPAAGKSSDSSSEKKENATSFTVTATAYTADCKGCSGITSTGINLKENPGSKVIAVDPSIIPLGSVVEVEGYGFAIAGDTGSAIRGKKIDVFVPTKKEALNWGVRSVKVTIH